MNTIEIFGILSSLVIFLSLSMTSIIKLRWINTLGCLMFAIYGYFIGSFSAVLLNLAIACLNLIYLKKLYSTKDTFTLIPADKNSEFFNFFLHNNYKDIEYFFAKPSFDNLNKIFFLIRNNSVAGIIGWTEKNNEITIEIDYVTERYRDLKFGKYLFVDNLDFFRNLGYKKIIHKTSIKEHINYIKKLGFIHESQNIYSKNIEKS